MGYDWSCPLVTGGSTNVLFIHVPIRTLTTSYARLVVPIRSANMVASMTDGVTLAYKDIAGMKLKELTREPNAHSDRKYDTESLIPILMFNLYAYDI